LEEPAPVFDLSLLISCSAHICSAKLCLSFKASADNFECKLATLLFFLLQRSTAKPEPVNKEKCIVKERIKDFFETDFDPGQPDVGQAATEERMAAALKYIAYQLGQINWKMSIEKMTNVG